MSRGYDLFKKQNEKSIDKGTKYAELVISEIIKKVEEPDSFSEIVTVHPKSRYSFILLNDQGLDELEYDSMKTTLEFDSFTLSKEVIDEKEYLIVHIDAGNSLKNIRSKKTKHILSLTAVVVVIAIGLVGVLLSRKHPSTAAGLTTDSSKIVTENTDITSSDNQAISESSATMTVSETSTSVESPENVYKINEWAPLTYEGKTIAEVRVTKLTTDSNEFRDYVQLFEKENLKNILGLTVEYKNISIKNGYAPTAMLDFSFFNNSQMLNITMPYGDGEKKVAIGRTGVMKPSFKFDVDVSKLNSVEIDFDYSSLISLEYMDFDSESTLHFKVDIER